MDVYMELINAVSRNLGAAGFIRRRNNFYIEREGNFGVINFQKSQDRGGSLVRFTINFGIYSASLRLELYGKDSSTVPAVEECHWQARIGAFLPGSPDLWWTVNTAEDIGSVLSDITGKLQTIVIPEISKRISDDGLINTWMNDKYAGTTEIERFRSLTILLKEKGDVDSLKRVAESFLEINKGRPNALYAKEHLKEIGYLE